MTIDSHALEQLLCKQLCAAVGVDTRPDGQMLIRTGFTFPDGDSFPFRLSETPSGGIRLSDSGHTLMHISYEHEIDAFLQGTRGALMERILNEAGVTEDGGSIFLETSLERLPQAIFALGQTLTRVYDLTLLSRSNVGSTFYDDLADCLLGLIDESIIERDYEPEVPNGNAYPVDYHVQSKSGVPLFVYGVPNRDKARLTTIMLGHFHRHQLDFESIIIFEDQAEIPRLDLARLSDVGGDMISSLDSADDLNRKLLRRVA